MSAPSPAARRDVRTWIALFRAVSPTGTMYASRGRGASRVPSASAAMTSRSRPSALRSEHRKVPLVQGVQDDALIGARERQERSEDPDVPNPGFDLLQTDRPHRADREGEGLRVGGERGPADDLGVQLIELAVPTFLRLLVPKRVPGGVQLQRFRAAPQTGDIESKDRGGELRTECKVPPALALERV